MPLRDASYSPVTPGSPVTTGGAPGDSLRWRVSSPLIALKAAGVLLFSSAAVISVSQPVGIVITLVAAATLAGSLLRDLLVPVRVMVGSEGLSVVSGFAGRRSLPWRAITRIHVDERRRLGVRSQLLEIETAESLYLFGGSELSAPVESVAAELESRWASFRARSPEAG